MKRIRRYLSTLNLIQFAMVVLISALLVFTNAFPTLAYTASKDNPTADDEIMKKSAEILQSGPPSLKTVESRSSQGPNEVQAGADLNKMSRPENSQNASTVEDKIEKALEKATPDK